MPVQYPGELEALAANQNENPQTGPPLCTNRRSRLQPPALALQGTRQQRRETKKDKSNMVTLCSSSQWSAFYNNASNWDTVEKARAHLSQVWQNPASSEDDCIRLLLDAPDLAIAKGASAIKIRNRSAV